MGCGSVVHSKRRSSDPPQVTTSAVETIFLPPPERQASGAGQGSQISSQSSALPQRPPAPLRQASITTLESSLTACESDLELERPTLDHEGDSKASVLDPSVFMHETSLLSPGHSRWIQAEGSEEKGSAVSSTASVIGFSPEERLKAYNTCYFYEASSGHVDPIALWVIGPSAVGKSTVTDFAATSFGIGGKCGSSRPDAVIVDGSHFRDAHSAYKSWVNTDHSAETYPVLKKRINKEKNGMLQLAAREKKHLLIPQTCLNLAACLTTVDNLRKLGYVNHVLALVASREEVARRGKAREVATGKRYLPELYDQSIAAIGPIIQACNGRYEVACTIKCPDPEKRPISRQVLCEGKCGSLPHLFVIDEVMSLELLAS